MRDLLYNVEQNVARLVINRPQKRNALSASAIKQMMEALDSAETDPNVRVVLITGAGDRAFCSGADLGNSFGGNSSFKPYANLIKRITNFDKPTVARVNGYCLAGGMGVMLACDIVIAREDSQFGTPEVNVGIFPMMIGALIFRNLHRKHAYELTMLGERIGTAKALEWGMINHAVSAENLDTKVDAICQAFASKSPIGLKLGKQAFHTMLELSFEDGIDFLSEQLSEVLTTKDASEGIQAFLEKRKPNFTGR
ncbi:MAG: enoyl-CoA hydratase/isomerase family protein [Candidatus Promineifilaceae bacterium]